MAALLPHSEMIFLCLSQMTGSAQELMSMVRYTSAFGCSLNEGGR